MLNQLDVFPRTGLLRLFRASVAGRLSGIRLQSPGAPAYRLDDGYQLNQYTNTTESGASRSIHDPDGNLTNDARFVYEWNGENRLVTAPPLAPTNVKQVRRLRPPAPPLAQARLRVRHPHLDPGRAPHLPDIILAQWEIYGTQ